MTGADRTLLDAGRLRVLREVELRGSIAAAARALDLSASAVSQQLAALEREAGVGLVDRTPRGVMLTGAGRALARRGDDIVQLLTAARADLDRLSGAVVGPVRIAAVASAALGPVSAAVVELADAAPGIDVSVLVAEPGESLRLLQCDDVDLAVVDEYDYVPLALPGPGAVTELGEESLCTVTAAAGLPGSIGAARDLADLAGELWVMPPEDAACGQAVRLACRASGFEPRVRWTSDDMLVLARAVAAGHGVAVLPRTAVPAEVEGLALAALDRPALRRRLRVVTRPATAGRPIIARVLSALARSRSAIRPHGEATSALSDESPLEKSPSSRGGS
jgi:molybdate transport repressor ModE-like protein